MKTILMALIATLITTGAFASDLTKRGIESCTALGPATSMEQLKIITDCIEKMNAIDAQYERDLSILKRQRLEQMNAPPRSGWIWVFPPKGDPYPVYIMGN